MTDGEDSEEGGPASDSGTTDSSSQSGMSSNPTPDDEESLQALRREVEEKYDFDSFGPADMAEMSVEEWEVAFDTDSWVTGEELLDRVEADLRSRVADRDVFAVVERTAADDKVVAYSERSYAVVHPDGSVEGEGAVFQDVKPSVALASMPEYDVSEPTADDSLPDPETVPIETGGLGNVMLQIIAAVFALAGLFLIVSPIITDLGGATIIAIFVGFLFLVVALGLLLAVANSRLSARYRAEEYRQRLRGAGVGNDERPEFLPIDDSEFED